MRRLLILKLVSLLLVGTAHAQDKVAKFANAIARTEGFYIKGTIPHRLHNPGDITTSLPHAYPGQVGIYRGYAIFKKDSYGWAALRDQIQRVIDGKSTRYTQDMTFKQIARIYAEDSRWAKTVCKILGIEESTTFAEYFELAPRVKMEAHEDLLVQGLFKTFAMVEVVPPATRRRNTVVRSCAR